MRQIGRQLRHLRQLDVFEDSLVQDAQSWTKLSSKTSSLIGVEHTTLLSFKTSIPSADDSEKFSSSSKQSKLVFDVKDSLTGPEILSTSAKNDSYDKNSSESLSRGLSGVLYRARLGGNFSRKILRIGV